jgi:hypothetical protein
VIFDPLHIAAELVALVQHRTVAVGQPRAFVEVTAGQFAQPVEMRLDMPKQRVRQIEAQKISQCRIGTIEIHAGCVGREQAALDRLSPIILEELVHFEGLLSSTF